MNPWIKRIVTVIILIIAGYFIYKILPMLMDIAERM